MTRQRLIGAAFAGPRIPSRSNRLSSAACVGILLMLHGASARGQDATRISFPKIDRHPAPASWFRPPLTKLPRFDPSAARSGSFQVDLRQRDLSRLTLRDRREDLLFADFDDGTVWPVASALPEGFDTARIMKLGKNPGLGVRELHKRGITGRGVGIAIIDQTLLVDHQEYVDRLRLYEETDDIVRGWREAQMHGPAVASIAVGKTVGVAPEADLYYIATALGGDVKDFKYLARCIHRIVEVNRQLPEGRKIRVIAMAIGWWPGVEGFAEITSACEKAKAAGMLVVSSSIEQTHGLKFQGLGRLPLSDPESFFAYEPGLFWQSEFFTNRTKPATRHWYEGRLLVPMDSRTTASPAATTEYAFYRQGGWSWSIPYLAGLYALAAQVDPAITPERFWRLALTTGKTMEVEHNGERVPLGPIVNPAKLIEAVRSGGR